MKPSHHEPGNNVVSRNRLGRSGRFPIIVISSERVPPRSKRAQERVPEQDFFGNVSHVSEHVGCIAHRAGGVIEAPGHVRSRYRRSIAAISRAGPNLQCAHQLCPGFSVAGVACAVERRGDKAGRAERSSWAGGASCLRFAFDGGHSAHTVPAGRHISHLLLGSQLW